MKIGIIGAGMVGATAAFAMVMRGVGREIVLVDKNVQRARAEADDILHAAPFADPFRIHAGDYEDLTGCRVVIITAGVAQKPGQSRMALLEQNAAIMKQITGQVLSNAPDSVLVVASNPVDVMTHVAAHYAAEFNVEPSRVIGSGTTLDTARFRALLGRLLGVDPQHVHAYVVGEHGDSEVLTWSLASVAGLSLEAFCQKQGIRMDAEVRDEIEQQVRQAAYYIIEGKGSTYYGIGSALARIVDVILNDQRAILTVCTPVAEVCGACNVTVSLPHLLGGQGILASLPLPLDEKETSQLKASADVVCDAIVKLAL
ncbi:MAG: L-lactate dehydrogenase [Anaerolineales bacterium]|nr:L-lactate dehydrogenase [Anaerolineales bacterium]